VDNNRLRRFVALTRQIEELKAELAPLEKERKTLQERLQTDFAQGGVRRVTVDGFTVYLHRSVYASYPEGKDAAKDALRASGHEEYLAVDFNHQSVSALVRDLLKAEADESPDDLSSDPEERLPEEWRGKLSFSEKYDVRTSRAS
jgi:hypothetical protein